MKFVTSLLAGRSSSQFLTCPYRLELYRSLQNSVASPGVADVLKLKGLDVEVGEGFFDFF